MIQWEAELHWPAARATPRERWPRSDQTISSRSRNPYFEELATDPLPPENPPPAAATPRAVPAPIIVPPRSANCGHVSPKGSPAAICSAVAGWASATGSAVAETVQSSVRPWSGTKAAADSPFLNPALPGSSAKRYSPGVRSSIAYSPLEPVIAVCSGCHFWVCAMTITPWTGFPVASVITPETFAANAGRVANVVSPSAATATTTEMRVLFMLSSYELKSWRTDAPWTQAHLASLSLKPTS